MTEEERERRRGQRFLMDARNVTIVDTPEEAAAFALNWKKRFNAYYQELGLPPPYPEIEEEAMPDKLEESRLWSIQGTLGREDKGVIDGAAFDLFMDDLCVLLDSHRLQFNGGASPLTQAQIDGDDDAPL